MRIDIITCLPKLLESFFGHSILKRAQDKQLAEVVVHDLRDYSVLNHKQIDDYSYGGGAGMVMMIEPLDRCISSLKAQRPYDAVLYMTPDGQRFEQKHANSFSLLNNLIIVCGHYKGIDERARQSLITHEISIGDFVLSGGELPAAVVTDAILRIIPGVLSDETSALTDSFQDGLLAPAVYTRPAEYNGMKVPEVLLSGNDALIEQWRMQNALERTQARRPDLYKKYTGEAE
jgi:tRNA (guanine37-N1)-methyltransferase